MNYRIVLAATAMLALAACGTSPSDTRAQSARLTPLAMLAQVRAAGQLGNELDVQPLRDPQVQDLRDTATQAEQRGDYAGAARAIAQALRLTPDDPDLLQWQAELALVGKDWHSAESLAMRSYDKGPKLGGLCRRNWSTLRYAREARGDAVGAGVAQQQSGRCAVTPPVRM